MRSISGRRLYERAARGGIRRVAVLAAVAVFAAMLLASTGGISRAAARKQPAEPRRLNIVFILADDENMSGPAVMPNVRNLLAKHGITFTNYNVTTSECGPSRASILKGQYSSHTGVWDNFGKHGFPAYNPSSDLPVWLHDAGYETALVGKYLNDYSLDGDSLTPPGWTDWQAMDSVPLEKYYNYSLDENGKVVKFGDKPTDYSTTVLTKKAVAFLNHAHAPFFLYFAPVAPHLPAIPAPKDVHALAHLKPFTGPAVNQENISSYPWAAYHSRELDQAGMVYTDHVRRHQLQTLLSIDRSVKAIVVALARRHLLNRTVIFYSSDNGFLWGEHRLGGKLWPYTPSVNVPLVVRTPWTAGNGTKNKDPILNIDFAWTISELAGITPGLPQDGQSFAPMLHGREIPWRNEYLIEYLGANKLHRGGPPPYVALRTPDYLYVHYRFKNWQELYDLRVDPYELHNVVSDPAYAPELHTLRNELHRMYEQQPHRALS
jgi:N-acetylglucosamine-6-sulfatase